MRPTIPLYCVQTNISCHLQLDGSVNWSNEQHPNWYIYIYIIFEYSVVKHNVNNFTNIIYVYYFQITSIIGKYIDLEINYYLVNILSKINDWSALFDPLLPFIYILDHQFCLIHFCSARTA